MSIKSNKATTKEDNVERVISSIGNTLFNAIFFFERTSEVALKTIDVVDSFADTAIMASNIANKNMQSLLDDSDLEERSTNKDAK